MTKKIMVVDDEPDTVELTTTVLTINRFQVSSFTKAKEALDSLKKGNIPDLIVLDVRMPEISGPDFCDELQKDKKLSKIRVVFFTASHDLDPALLKKHKASGFILKPFDNNELIKSINSYLKK